MEVVRKKTEPSCCCWPRERRRRRRRRRRSVSLLWRYNCLAAADIITTHSGLGAVMREQNVCYHHFGDRRVHC